MNATAGKFMRSKFECSRHSLIFAVVIALALSGCARGSSSAADEVPQLPPLQFAGAWGTRGTGPDQLDVPVGIATDVLGHVYIADAGNSSIEKFTPEGGPLLSFGDAWIEKAAGVAVDRGGGIYVAEGSRLQVFWPEGDRLHVTYGGLLGATGVAVDSDGNYYVTDRMVCRVTAFDVRGRVLRTWGRRGTADGEFTDPSGVAIGVDGSVYVADAGGARVQKFTPDGTWLASFGHPDASGDTLGEHDAVGLAVSARAIFLVGGAAPLRVWTLDGQAMPVDPAVLDAAQAATPNDATSHVPPTLRAVAVTLDPSGDLLLLDAASDRVLRFHVHL
jgi:DNA-binding beta-propeller fold protein YncE